ncbi:MAG: hypothetical protein QE485_10630 [Acidovorax sp.]|uniref:hypothetical protein n=1 Tax=Acidovorax sp. TaxID=1872122 RepID=UPI00262D1562|nr:hypothetical protein [Acidovorax sp.]MDH4417670.1 hypothetical protein [Acidovorax sp.]
MTTTDMHQDTTTSALALYHAAMLEEQAGTGDTGGKPESDGAPTTVSDADQGQVVKNEPVQPAPKDEPDPANAVILAKDGKHTIPYSKLEEARQNEQAARAAAKAAQDELAALRAQADQRAAAGVAPTAVDNASAIVQKALESGEVDPAIFGDFSEGAMAKGIATMVREGLTQGFTALREELAPIKDQHQISEVEKHYGAIYQAHPDADSVAESKELESWLASKPSFAQTAYRAVLAPESKSTAKQVIELFDTFKKETGATQAASAPAPSVDPKAAAKAAIAAIPPAVPTSLSDFPGGRSGPTSFADRMASMSEVELFNAVNTGEISQAQLNDYLNRTL